MANFCNHISILAATKGEVCVAYAGNNRPRFADGFDRCYVLYARSSSRG